MLKKIELGDKVKDTVTGFVGIAVARINWIAGCNRIIVMPQCKKGKEHELEEDKTFDEPLLKVLKKKAVKGEEKKKKEETAGTTGGTIGYLKYGS